MHITVGGAGNNEGVERKGIAGKGTIAEGGVYDATGFGRLAVINRTALEWTFRRSANPSVVVDSVLLSKKPR